MSQRTKDAVLNYGEGELEVTGITAASFQTIKYYGTIKFEHRDSELEIFQAR